MRRCCVCQRPLKNPKAIAAGIGAKCQKKIDQEAAYRIKEIADEGFDFKIQDGRVIQLQIRVDDHPI